MGEIAEMMLDGTLCEGCGAYIDDGGADGIPRYCSPQCAEDRGAVSTGLPFGARARRWLTEASAPQGVGYERAPAYLIKLENRGLVRNQVVSPDGKKEKVRFFITKKGRDKLARLES